MSDFHAKLISRFSSLLLQLSVSTNVHGLPGISQNGLLFALSLHFNSHTVSALMHYYGAEACHDLSIANQ